MKRLLLLCLVAAAVFAVPGQAHAAVPCRDRIYNDWYADGKIASTYPIACYRDALAHVKGDLQVYSSLSDDIRSALQAAIERRAGKRVPAQVGKGLPRPTAVSAVKRRARTSPRTAPQPEAQTTTTLALGPVASAGGGGGTSIPLPLLVLGGLAVALAAAGAIGAIVRRRRGPLAP